MIVNPLTFDSLATTQTEIRWDISAFATPGAAAKGKKCMSTTNLPGVHARAKASRLPLLELIHETILDDIESGARASTIETRVRALMSFYCHADRQGKDPTTENVLTLFCEFAAFQEARAKRKEIKQDTVYGTTLNVAIVIASILETDSAVLLRKARVGYPNGKGYDPGPISDRDPLHDAIAFGSIVVRLAKALTIETVRGPIPIEIPLTDDYTHRIWCRLKPERYLKELSPDSPSSVKRRATERRERRSEDGSREVRSSAINLRLEAELLLFISQTSMNLAQARSIQVQRVSFQSYHGGYTVRAYKARARHPVTFDIYSEYRSHFESYLAWRKEIFGSDEDLLFPLLFRTAPLRIGRIHFQKLRELSRALNVKFVGPRAFRSLRVNWLVRKSADPELTAEIAQHTRETLLRHYLKPDHNVAVIEATRFWNQHDPFLAAPGPGHCDHQVPISIPTAPPEAPKPDCQLSSGCLFCRNHRDLATFDYVWSLTTLRQLKTLELSKSRLSRLGDVPHPAEAVIDRITLKLGAFAALGNLYKEWVGEALMRMDEESYHPAWAGFIRIAELA